MKCTVCTHPDMVVINTALMRPGAVLAQLAAKHGVSDAALARHRDRHLAPSGPTHIDPSELLADLIATKAHAEMLAYDPRLDPSEQLAALREVRQTSEAIAKLSGAYSAADPKTMMPLWSRIRTALLGALERFPDARDAVIIALEEAMARDA
jgi:hypothetical protein